ncbi:PD-(D/E)XK nuclease family protein [Bradyrhizobium sp. DASA03120]|uniref:PD-(D/E)XK nuclease family protein n=1 Tax=Bradyrhizobium sp. SMVTL-02 TaxID=3395917 RepID=UPI003F713270
MRWSYSASRSFRQCQRQWFFKNIAASGRANDPLRRRAFLLSKLQSLSAWRGKVVDDVISTMLVPVLNRRGHITLKGLKERASDLFNRQLEFALAHPINDPNLRVTDEGDEFALFYDMEYGQRPSDIDIAQAWSDVDEALTNLFKMERIRDGLKSASYLVAQRGLQFELMDGVTVLAYPDVIAFAAEGPPLIIDWKVHAFGENDARLQLAIYAIALSRAKRHVDFPDQPASDPSTVALIEAQLLTQSVREHQISEEEIIDAEEYMISSAYEITSLTEGKPFKDLSAKDFQAAQYAESCQRCSFRTICWESLHAN